VLRWNAGTDISAERDGQITGGARSHHPGTKVFGIRKSKLHRKRRQCSIIIPLERRNGSKTVKTTRSVSVYIVSDEAQGPVAAAASKCSAEVSQRSRGVVNAVRLVAVVCVIDEKVYRVQSCAGTIEEQVRKPAVRIELQAVNGRDLGERAVGRDRERIDVSPVCTKQIISICRHLRYVRSERRTRNGCELPVRICRESIYFKVVAAGIAHNIDECGRSMG